MKTNQSDALTDLIKEIAVKAINANKPTSIYYGTVISISPLKVQISSNLILTEEFLIVPMSLTDYTVQVSMNWSTENANIDHTHNVEYTDKYTVSGDTDNKTTVTKQMNSNKTHSHALTGVKEITIYNSLKIGDKVILTQVQGGQEFIINDKVG